MGTAFNPAKTSPASWDAFSDVDAFVDAVLAELAAMAADGTRSTRSGKKPPLTGAALRKAIMAIWCVAFAACSGAHRAALRHSVRHAVLPVRPVDPAVAPAAQPLDPFLAAGLRRYCRPSAVIIDSRSCQSAPSCFTRGFDGGKKIKGIKIHLAVDKYGFPLGIARLTGQCS